MKRNAVRCGVGAVLVAAALGVPGPAAAEPAGSSRVQAAAEIGLGRVWDFLARIFQADEPSTGTKGGEGTNGGGAMDPNGGPPTGGPKPTGGNP